MTMLFLKKAQSDGAVGGGDVDPSECQPWAGPVAVEGLGGWCTGVTEREGEGAPPVQFLPVTPPAHCILGTSFCSFQNPSLGLP